MMTDKLHQYYNYNYPTFRSRASTTTTTIVLRPFIPDYPDHHPIFISFFHLLWSIASSLFKLRAWKSFLHNLSAHSLWSASWSGALHLITYSLHFFTQSVSSFRNTCPYHHSPKIYQLFLVLLSTPYLELYLRASTYAWTFNYNEINKTRKILTFYTNYTNNLLVCLLFPTEIRASFQPTARGCPHVSTQL